ncbi:hypothetical protein B0H21DRAFT_360658 [Amylocystis lapponica]|nr:hypothetical protein B0H21DRAFT_360658 [Amylocystis lapponica]
MRSDRISPWDTAALDRPVGAWRSIKCGGALVPLPITYTPAFRPRPQPAAAVRLSPDATSHRRLFAFHPLLVRLPDGLDGVRSHSTCHCRFPSILTRMHTLGLCPNRVCLSASHEAEERTLVGDLHVAEVLLMFMLATLASIADIRLWFAAGRPLGWNWRDSMHIVSHTLCSARLCFYSCVCHLCPPPDSPRRLYGFRFNSPTPRVQVIRIVTADPAVSRFAINRRC